MTFEPLVTASIQIQLHVVFALIAIFLGPLALYRKRRDRVHKIAGYVWVSGLVGLSATGLFIPSNFPVIGPFGPIHLLCFLALWGCVDGVIQARRRDFKRHEATMKSLWYGAIWITGLLTLMPGRTLNRMLFGEPSAWGFALIALGLLGLFALWWRTSRPRRHGPVRTGNMA